MHLYYPILRHKSYIYKSYLGDGDDLEGSIRVRRSVGAQLGVAVSGHDTYFSIER